MRIHTHSRIGGFLAVLLFSLLLAGTASAQVYYLVAEETTLTMPDGQMIPAWGFGLDQDGDFATTDDYEITVPGPALEVPSGHANLVIRLKNNLPERISLNMVGQRMTNNNGPVWDNGSTGSRPSGNYSARIRSFAHECPPGATRAYRWNGIKPGSYLLTSGTNPAKQIQMGLYAPVFKDSGNNQEAYPGVFYDRAVNVVFSEIDPMIQQAIADGDYGPGRAITSSVFRHPRFFLLNGLAHPDMGLDPLNGSTPLNLGETVLLRFFNAGGETHVPQLLGKYMTLVAEDGNPYAYPKEQYGFELAAGKTTDAVVTFDSAARIPLYDAALKMSNAGTEDGGMLAYLTSAEAFTGIGLNFNDYDVLPYGGNQDENPAVSIEDGGNTLHIVGNGWKQIDFPYAVTPDTILEFDFKTTAQADIHGIGFDTDDTINNPIQVFQIYGTQNWGPQPGQSYDGSGDWMHFRIPLRNTAVTGKSFTSLVFVNDHDVANPDGESLFQNVRVYDPADPNEVVTIERLVFRGDLDPTRMVVRADSTAASAQTTLTAYAHFGSRTELMGDLNYLPDPNLADYRVVFNPYDMPPDRVTIVSSQGGSDHGAGADIRIVQ